MRTTTVAVGVVLLAVSAAAGAPGETKATTPVEATGEAAITGDAAQARDKAIEDALRKAVEQAVGTLVAADTEVRNNQLVSDRIFTKARGYVAGYDVVGEKTDKGVVRVTVKAKVGTDQLGQDLMAIGLTLLRKGMPRILVLVGEQAVDDQAPRTWWAAGSTKDVSVSLERGIVEKTLLASWTPEGFTFIDHETLGGALKKQGSLQSKKQDKTVVDFAALTDADIVIHGQATVLPTHVEVAGIKKSGCTATVDLRASTTDANRVLAQVLEKGELLHPIAAACSAELLQRLTGKLDKDFKGKILAQWQQQLDGGGEIVLKVSGVDFAALTQLKANLGSLVRGVKGVTQRSFKKNEAELAVLATLTPQALGEALEGQKVKKKVIHVTGVTANTLSIELTK